MAAGAGIRSVLNASVFAASGVHSFWSVATLQASALAVPDVLHGIDVETRVGLLVEGTEADQFLAAAP